jgi:hypothetical protein
MDLVSVRANALAMINHYDEGVTRIPFTGDDLLMDVNDCAYYFPEYDYSWMGSSLICITGLHHRPIPGAYKLPFGEGFYLIQPEYGDE